MDDNKITYFGQTDARNKRVKFGIRAKDRTRHVYVIGKTGMGKSTLLENMAVQDIQNGEGLCFIDPHGKTADLLLEYVPENRVKDVILIAPFDTEYPISFNVLESVDANKRHLVVSGLMSTFKKIWVDAWSARMEYILTNTLLALLEAPGSTLLGVNKMLSDKEYRKEVISHIKDPSVKTFWTKEFASYTERMAAEAVPAIQNKVGQFTANPLIRNMIGQPTSSFDFREAIDSRKIIIINLSKGRIGDENMKLLGGLLVTKIYLAAMSRADVTDRVLKTLPNFYLFVDEFQNFANASFADILSEARKYKLNLTIAHQYIEQMDEVVRAAVFGNVGTMITFRVGATDAEVLEKEYAPEFTVEDLVNLGFAQIYLKLMIDGLTSAPFSATTLPPIPHPDVSFVKEIIVSSRAQFAHPRAEVEAIIEKFHESTPKKATEKTIEKNGEDVGRKSSDKPPFSKPPVLTSKESHSNTILAKFTPVTVTRKPGDPLVVKPTFSHPQEFSQTTNPREFVSGEAVNGVVDTGRGADRRQGGKKKISKRDEVHQPFKSALADVLKKVGVVGAAGSSQGKDEKVKSKDGGQDIKNATPHLQNTDAVKQEKGDKTEIVTGLNSDTNNFDKTVKLSDLQTLPKMSPKPSAKIASKENINALKEALAKVKTGQNTNQVEQKKESKIPSQSDKKDESKSESKLSPREVPEEVLKKVLKVE